MARMKNLMIALAVGFAAVAAVAPGAAPAFAVSVTWMKGFAAPLTPVRYDKVGVMKVGPSSARNVLVLEPGTSAGGAYFVPLARWIVARAPDWQVWSVERRENLLEDQSALNAAKRGQSMAGSCSTTTSAISPIRASRTTSRCSITASSASPSSGG